MGIFFLFIENVHDALHIDSYSFPSQTPAHYVTAAQALTILPISTLQSFPYCSLFNLGPSTTLVRHLIESTDSTHDFDLPTSRFVSSPTE